MYFQIELHVEVGGAIAEMSVGSIAFKKVKGRRQNPIIVCFKEISWPHLSIQSIGRVDFCILFYHYHQVCSQNQFIDSLHGHVQSKTSQLIGRMKITSYRMTSSYFSVFSLSNVYPFLAFLQLVYSLQDVIVDIGKKILPLWFCERSRLILSGCLVSASSHISSVHFAPPFLMRHCGLG